MPILSVVTAISKNYPNIAVNPDKYFFEKNLIIFACEERLYLL